MSAALSKLMDRWAHASKVAGIAAAMLEVSNVEAALAELRWSIQFVTEPRAQEVMRNAIELMEIAAPLAAWSRKNGKADRANQSANSK